MRTLDDIIPPSRRREAPPGDGQFINNSEPRRRSRFPLATLFVVLIIIAVSIGALFYFSNAKVEVTPNTVSAAVQGSFTASKNGSDIPFEVITAQKVASQSVTGNGTKTVNSSASGSLTIYNAQTQSQRLITNTRFATAAGLIFRIHSPVTIPGGSASKPGSVTVKVFADQSGDTYNVGPTSFTIPGFAGTPQESLVYGRSSSAMTGGASGTVPVVDAVSEAEAEKALITALEPDLLASIQTKIPSGYVLVPGSATTTYQKLAAETSATSGMVDIKEQGTITVVVFPNAALAGAIANSITGLDYHNEPITLSSTDGLALSLSSFPDPDASSISFTINGTASFVYTVDPTRIAAAIAGKTRSDAEVALKNYPEIKSAFIILRPFWRPSFPEDPSAISVVTSEAR